MTTIQFVQNVLTSPVQFYRQVAFYVHKFHSPLTTDKSFVVLRQPDPGLHRFSFWPLFKTNVKTAKAFIDFLWLTTIRSFIPKFMLKCHPTSSEFSDWSRKVVNLYTIELLAVRFKLRETSEWDVRTKEWQVDERSDWVTYDWNPYINTWLGSWQ